MEDIKDDGVKSERLRFWLLIATMVSTLLTTVVTTVGGIALAYVNSSHNMATQEKVEKVEGTLKKAAASVEAKVDEAAAKAEVAATKAEAAEVKAEDNHRTSLNTNAALNEWKASYTKAPEDIQAAERAKASLQKMEAATDSPK